MTPVGAGHERQRTTTGPDPGGGRFTSVGVFVLGPGVTTGATVDLPGVVYCGMSLHGASQ